MKWGLYICLILASTICAAQVHEKITLQVSGEALIDVLYQIEQKLNLTFTYDHNILKNINVEMNLQDEPLEIVLKKLLEGTNLEYEIIRNQFIIIKRKGELGYKELSGGKICGFVLDDLTLEPLEFASVVVQNSNRGVNTNSKGRFELLSGFKNTDSLTISYLGYERKTIAINELSDQSCPNIYLKTSILSFGEILVLEYLTDGISQSETALSVNLNPNHLGILPGLSEPDILQSIQLLPGVSSPDETASGIHIRGGTPDQNLILCDGIPIYHSGHFFGMISAFNPYIVQEVKVFRGGFDAQYGGRVAGVVDIQNKERIPEKLSANIGANLTHGYASVHIPVIENQSGLLLSFRRSFTNVFQKPTFEVLANRVYQGTQISEDRTEAAFDDSKLALEERFSFSDLNAKWTYLTNQNDQINISFLNAGNILNIITDDPELDVMRINKLDLRNVGISTSWSRKWTPSFQTNSEFAYSNYRYEFGELTNDNTTYEELKSTTNKNGVEEWNMKISMEGDLTEKLNLETGYQFINQKTIFDVEEIILGGGDFLELSETQSSTHALYGNLNWESKKKLSITGGIRYHYFKILNTHRFEPRLFFKYPICNNWLIKANLGWYNQFINEVIQLDFNSLNLNNQTWHLADGEEFLITQSRHFMTGVFFKKKGWQIDIEGYIKKLNGLTSQTTSLTNLQTNFLSNGFAKTQGIDFLIKKRWSNYRSWLSYSFAHTNYTFELLNENESFSAPHDQRHRLNWVHTLTYPKWEFSIGWTYATGKPFTNLISQETILNADNELTAFPVFDQINNERLTSFHRLDASAIFKFSSKQISRWKGKLGFSFANIYNRKNQLSLQYLPNVLEENEVDNVISLEKKSLEFLPNLVIRIEW